MLARSAAGRQRAALAAAPVLWRWRRGRLARQVTIDRADIETNRLWIVATYSGAGVQRYLGLLERERYIRLGRGDERASRMCIGLAVSLLEPLFPGISGGAAGEARKFHRRKKAASRAALHRAETERLAVVRHARILP
jgi:hypothetical protein